MGFPEAAGQFLLHFLTPLSQLLHSIFYPLFNIFSQRCHQHHCWAQLWPALSGCVQHGSSPVLSQKGHPSSTSCYENLGTCTQYKILSQTHEKMSGYLG